MRRVSDRSEISGNAEEACDDIDGVGEDISDDLAVRVSRANDEVVVGLRSLYQYTYQCQAPDCQHVSVSYQSEGDAVSMVEEHWMRQHNRACEARYSAVTHLGYLCTVCGCSTVMYSAMDLLQHYTTHQEVLPKDMAVRDLTTQQVLTVEDIFTVRTQVK
jgi:hypothetical protein